MPGRQRVRKPHARGFTLLELIIAILIVAILAAIIIPSYHAFKRQAQRAACIGKLRSLHSAFDGYLLENGRWPQMPEGGLNMDESEFFGFWIKALEDYGAGPDVWVCPADIRREEGLEKGEYVGSYIPTQFDAHSYTPHRWNQPWVMERGDFHGKGAHVLMPDGTVFASTNPFGDN